MTINEVIAYICERQIPKEINGVRTKYTWTTSQKVEAARKEMDIDEEGDPFDELFK